MTHGLPEGAGKVKMWGKRMPGMGNSTCEILKAGTCLVSSRKKQDASIAGCNRKAHNGF